MFYQIFIKLAEYDERLKISDTSIFADFRLLAWELPALKGLIDLGKCPDDSDFIWTAIKPRTSSILGQIELFTWKLLAL